MREKRNYFFCSIQSSLFVVSINILPSLLYIVYIGQNITTTTTKNIYLDLICVDVNDSIGIPYRMQKLLV